MLSPIGSFTPITTQSPLTPARLDRTTAPGTTQSTTGLSGAHEFGNLFTKLVDQVDSTQQTAAAETQKVMLGQTDQLHNAMISLQESSLALGMMVEVRNKLVESYQELMRMPV